MIFGKISVLLKRFLSITVKNIPKQKNIYIVQNMLKNLIKKKTSSSKDTSHEIISFLNATVFSIFFSYTFLIYFLRIYFAYSNVPPKYIWLKGGAKIVIKYISIF